MRQLILTLALLTSTLAAQTGWRAVPIYAAPFLGTILDTESSQHFAAHHCRETDPLYGQPPNRGKLYGIGIPLAAAVDLTAFALRHHRGWWTIPLAYGSIRGYSGVRNIAIGCD